MTVIDTTSCATLLMAVNVPFQAQSSLNRIAIPISVSRFYYTLYDGHYPRSHEPAGMNRIHVRNETFGQLDEAKARSAFL